MRRRLTKLVIFLLLGAVVNVAVAWTAAFACRATPVDSRTFQVLSSAPRFQVFTTTGRRIYYRHDFLGSRLYCAWSRSYGKNDAISLDELRNSPLPRWADLNPKRGGYGSVLADQYEAHGWPLLSFSASIFKDESDEAFVVGGFALPEPNRLTMWYSDLPRVLPFRPIWTGFLVNIPSYAAILWLLLCAPLALRRTIRRKRGRCPICNYDLHHAYHDACPECGATA